MKGTNLEYTAYGKIIKGVGGLYTVALSAPFECEDKIIPKQNLQCRVRGSFRHNGQKPTVGDNVTLLVEGSVCNNLQNSTDESGSGIVITKIEERKNSLIRPPLANIDYLFICIAAASPKPSLLMYDKLISIACFNKIEPVIVISKCDIDQDYAEELISIYLKTPHKCFMLNATDKESCSDLLNFIENEMCGKITAFAGASGVGKSTLLNTLFPNLALSTSGVSIKIERGRHTTRHVELFPLTDKENSGYIADTPGFSMLDFERFDFFTKEELPETFAEFIPFLGDCKYKKCTHTKEESCAILQAVSQGVISKSRHDSFLDMYNTLKHKNAWD